MNKIYNLNNKFKSEMFDTENNKYLYIHYIPDDIHDDLYGDMYCISESLPILLRTRKFLNSIGDDNVKASVVYINKNYLYDKNNWVRTDELSPGIFYIMPDFKIKFKNFIEFPLFRSPIIEDSVKYGYRNTCVGVLKISYENFNGKYPCKYYKNDKLGVSFNDIIYLYQKQYDNPFGSVDANIIGFELLHAVPLTLKSGESEALFSYIVEDVYPEEYVASMETFDFILGNSKIVNDD